jgi:hypothetical protein
MECPFKASRSSMKTQAFNKSPTVGLGVYVTVEVGVSVTVGLLMRVTVEDGVSEGAAVWVISAFADTAAAVWMAGAKTVTVAGFAGWQAARNKAQRMKIS